MTLLDIRRLTKRFGSLTAVDNLSLDVQAGERRSVIGPNGAGKTTLFHIVSGRFRPDEGEILFRDTVISGLQPHKIARLGMARSFQITNIFGELTVLENVRLAIQARDTQTGSGPRRRSDIADTTARAMDLLGRLGLSSHSEALAGTLSYGDQRRIEIGLTLAMEPSLVLLDEPTAGMSRGEAQEIVELLETIPRDVTIILIEHDIDIVFKLSDRITVMTAGQVLADGTPSQIERNERVQEAYFGGLANDD